ncbi:hypothetical protein [Magnetospirillum fulvum]|jgi:hypothetical protein|uniref:Uncharacterized protein n=1 Tax=Magnetospirillum fulvum TaxID=1082 RepID=A0A1H6HMP3_MAGFU|nr:hypothetical protein [Magnetospirillum fulvum]SEH35508.1 hypothetical protein SAMN04244559_01789 [Magnetospirillum fulvum]
MTISKEGEENAALLGLLARWQAFSELQQRAFTFLAAEAIATGEEFENSTDGAAAVLGQMGCAVAQSDPAQLQAETFSVIQSLQSADRSRQGLEQVASVLETFRRLEAELVEETQRHPPLPPIQVVMETWSRQLSESVTLSDWRRRFAAALDGRDPGPRNPAPAETCDEELFF